MMDLTPFDHPNSYRNLWSDPEIEARIVEGIETHRKSDAVVRVVTHEGKPAAGVPVKALQTDSSFHFGANIFKLGSYETPEDNRRYEESFCSLFNAATVPFYWKTLEPEPGRLRFGAESEFIARRPPPDVVVDFCLKHGLRMHGHTLVWVNRGWFVPDWLPRDPEQVDRIIENRIREIAERYGSVIKRWDVVNEAEAGYPPEEAHALSPDYEGKAFDAAARYFAPDVRLDINETTGYWYPHKKAYVDLISRLLEEGRPVQAVGLQFHIMADEEMSRLSLGERFHPRQMFDALDLHAQFNLPIHISEITMTAPENNSPAGLELQADAARNYYRLWFSHPSTEGITWWNVPDGGAAPGEDNVFSGLLYGDLTPKPSYHALKKLLHEEWRTEVSGTTDVDGCFRFRGFHGNYEIQADTRTFLHLEPGKTAVTTLRGTK